MVGALGALSSDRHAHAKHRTVGEPPNGGRDVVPRLSLSIFFLGGQARPSARACLSHPRCLRLCLSHGTRVPLTPSALVSCCLGVLHACVPCFMRACRAACACFVRACRVSSARAMLLARASSARACCLCVLHACVRAACACCLCLCLCSFLRPRPSLSLSLSLSLCRPHSRVLYLRT